MPANANGVLYALAGFSGALPCYVMDGILSYEFNLFEIERTKIKARNKLPAGKAKNRGRIQTGRPQLAAHECHHEGERSGCPRRAKYQQLCHCTSQVTSTFDIGSDVGSPVSLDYFEQSPFAFNGTVSTTKISYLKR